MEVEQRRLVGGAVAALATAIGVWATVGSGWLEPHLSSNGDEHAYVQQADLLAHGRLTVDTPVGALARSFQPWFAVATQHGYLFKYNPTWSGVLAIGFAVGAPRLVLGLTVALFAFGVYFLVSAVATTRGRALLATSLVVLSPLTVILSTGFLPYVFFGALWTVTAGLLIRATRERRRWQLVAAALLGAVALCFRPYDALLVLGPFAIWSFSKLWPDRATLWRGVVAAGVVAAPVVVMQAVYNAVFTGSATTFPFALWSPSDRFGFGPRGLDPSGVPQVDFGLRAGVESVLAHIGQLNIWACGGFVLAGAALCGFLLARRRPAVLPVVAVAVVVPVGYLFFWGVYNAGTEWDSFGRFGPFYFFPLLIPMSIFAAEALAVLWSRRRWAGTFVVIAIAVLGSIGLVDAIRAAVIERNARAQPYSLLANRLGGTQKDLVLLPGAFVGNAVPDLYSLHAGRSTRVLYAVSQGNADLDLVKGFAHHVPYRLVGCDYSGRGVLGSSRLPVDTDAPFPRVDGKGARLERLRVVRGAALHFDLFVNTSEAGHATLSVAAGTMSASAPLQIDAQVAAGVSIDITPTGISIRGAVGETSRSHDGESPLAVALTFPAGHVGTISAFQWNAPLRVTGRGLTLLGPVRDQRVERIAGQDWTLDLCRPDPRAKLQLARREQP